MLMSNDYKITSKNIAGCLYGILFVMVTGVKISSLNFLFLLKIKFCSVNLNVSKVA